jgi:hypothetical protein
VTSQVGLGSDGLRLSRSVTEVTHVLSESARVVFDDERAVANAGVMLPAVLVGRLGIERGSTSASIVVVEMRTASGLFPPLVPGPASGSLPSSA